MWQHKTCYYCQITVLTFNFLNKIFNAFNSSLSIKLSLVLEKTLHPWLTNTERYKMGKASRAGYENRNLKFSKKRKKNSLNPLNHILVAHLGQGINFLTMLHTAKVTLLRKPPQYLWTFILPATYCRPLCSTQQKKKSGMNFRCMKSEPPWTSIRTLLTATYK